MDPFGRRSDGCTPFRIWSSTGTSGDLNVALLMKNRGSAVLWADGSITAFSNIDNAHKIKHNI